MCQIGFPHIVCCLCGYDGYACTTGNRLGSMSWLTLGGCLPPLMQMPDLGKALVSYPFLWIDRCVLAVAADLATKSSSGLQRGRHCVPLHWT